MKVSTLIDLLNKEDILKSELYWLESELNRTPFGSSNFIKELQESILDKKSKLNAILDTDTNDNTFTPEQAKKYAEDVKKIIDETIKRS